MLVTKLLWKSLDRLAFFHSFLWRNPLDWKPARGKPVYNPISIKLLPWACSVLLTILFTFIPTFVILVAQLFGFVNVTLPSLVVNLVNMSLAGFSIIGDVSFAIVANTVVATFNSEKAYEARLHFGKV